MWSPRQTEVQLEGCRLDLIRRRVYFDDRTLKLTSREVEVLRYLLDHPDQVTSKDDLEHEVWELAPNVRTDAVSIAMRRLRTKIERDPANPVHLHTVYGVGWRFHLPDPVDVPRTTGNLPPSPDTFVGRQTELAALDTLGRCISITGPPGVGKSRLALEWARNKAEDVSEVWLVDCAASSGESTTARVASTLDLRKDSEEAVLSALRSRGPAILILDGAEGVDPVGGWLDECPDLTILVTCRGDGPGSRFELSPMPAGEAADLLRARMLAIDRAPGSETELEALVDATDGIPLALELCASHTRLLTLDQLADRIRARPLGPVREAFAWSWDQLAPEVQAFGLAMCAFADAFTLESAQALAPTGGDPLDSLTELADRSMIRIDPEGPRFSMSPGVRQILLERLGPEPKARHARWFLEWGEATAARIPTSDGAHAIQSLRRELAELDLARKNSSGAQRVRLALIENAALFQIGAPARRLRILRDAGDDAPDELMGRLLGERGHVHSVLGDLDAARTDLTRALELDDSARNWRYLGWLRLRMGHDNEALEAIQRGIAHDDPDPETAAALHGDLGLVLMRMGHRAEAEAAIRHGLGIAIAAGDATRQGLLHMRLGDYHSYYNEYARAEVELRRAVELNDAVGATAYTGFSESVLGLVLTQQERPDEALIWLEKASDRLRRLGDDAYLISALNSLAELKIQLRDYPGAVVSCSEAERLSRREGLSRYRALILVTQATAYRLMQAPEQARRCLEQAEDVAQSRREQAYAKAHLAAISADAGQVEDARRYLAEGEAIAPDVGDPNLRAMLDISRAHVELARDSSTSIAPVLAQVEPLRAACQDVAIAVDLLLQRFPHRTDR